jgi:hypothetical protein
MTHPFYELMVGGVLLAPFVRYAVAALSLYVTILGLLTALL